MAEIPNPFDMPARVLTNQEKQRNSNRMYKDLPLGTPAYLSVTGEDLDAPGVNSENVMKMSQYVNPELALHSDYFKTLDKMMKCVEKNASVTDPI